MEVSPSSGISLPLPDAFLEFLNQNGLDPSIYVASDSVPRYVRYFTFNLKVYSLCILDVSAESELPHKFYLLFSFFLHLNLVFFLCNLRLNSIFPARIWKEFSISTCTYAGIKAFFA